MKRKMNKKGFTIVELVIVIAVIAILAAVLIPTFVSLVKKANLSADQQAIKQMNDAIVIVSVDKTFNSVDDLVVALLNENIDISDYNPMTKDHSFYWIKSKNKIVLVDKDLKVIAPKDLVESEYDESDWTELGSSVLYNALGGGATIGSDGKVDMAAGNTSYAITGTSVLNLEDTVISYNLVGEQYDLLSGSTIDGSAFCANGADANLTVNEGIIETNLYGVSARKGATVTIDGTSITAGSHCVYAQQGTITILDGFFSCEDSRMTLNCNDTAYRNGSANIVVKGGTFVNFDPSNSLSEGNTPVSFVADGYKVISETQSNGDVWYTVVAE